MEGIYTEWGYVYKAPLMHKVALSRTASTISTLHIMRTSDTLYRIMTLAANLRSAFRVASELHRHPVLTYCKLTERQYPIL